jgi:UDP-glucose 4-epimerase
MIYVDNVVDAMVNVLGTSQALGGTYPLCDEEPPFSTPQLCRALGDALGRPARQFRFPPLLLEAVPGARKLTRSLEVDARAIRERLGWKAPYSAAEGLLATARWYRAR